MRRILHVCIGSLVGMPSWGWDDGDNPLRAHGLVFAAVGVLMRGRWEAWGVRTVDDIPTGNISQRYALEKKVGLFLENAYMCWCWCLVVGLKEEGCTWWRIAWTRGGGGATAGLVAAEITRHGDGRVDGAHVSLT